MIQKLVIKLLKKLVIRLPSRTITGLDGTPYLTRWYLWPGKPRTDGDGDALALPFAVFVHFFHRGDEDRDPHNHPWNISAAFVLAGGYREERGDCVRTFKPGSVNIIRKDDYHRVDLLDPANGSWSLFVAGRNVSSWGFRDDRTGEHIPHREYLARKFGVSS